MQKYVDDNQIYQSIICIDTHIISTKKGVRRMTEKRFDFPSNIVELLLRDENGDLYELKDTKSVKIWSQLEQGRIFEKGRKIE